MAENDAFFALAFCSVSPERQPFAERGGIIMGNVFSGGIR
jgi:hypothetical protein